MAAEDSIESPASWVQSSFKSAGREEAATPVNCGLPRNCAHSPGAGGSAAEPSQTPAGDHLQDNHAYTRATRLLLPSVEVLAVDDSTTVTKPTNSEDKPTGLGAAAMQPTTTLLTLAVTQDQAQRLVHGSRTGTLTFALLGPDAQAKPGAGVNDRSLFEVTR